MIKVNNKKIISKIAKKNLKINKVRNYFLMSAILLVTIMITALFSVAANIQYTLREQKLREVGVSFQGGYSYITAEQLKKLCTDSSIKNYGVRRHLASPINIPYNNPRVEITYMDKICAKGYFCSPEVGEMPKENSNEIACDTRILKVLGIEPKIGAEVKLSYYIGEKQSRKLVKDTFKLCGWWQYDPNCMVSYALVPHSYTEKVLSTYKSTGNDDMTGRYILNVNFNNNHNVIEQMKEIVKINGYQCDNVKEDNYIYTNSNFVYEHMDQLQPVYTDLGSWIVIIGTLFIIMITGYFLIRNILNISVVKDIKFYGLLKTIGTTKKQIKRILFIQILRLSAMSIPFGLIIGYFCGEKIVQIMYTMAQYKKAYYTIDPLIFIISIIVSFILINIACYAPKKLAADVSPLEIVKYSEYDYIKNSNKRKTGKIKITGLAKSNFIRHKSKNIMVIASLIIAVTLFQITYIFTNGIDTQKILKNNYICDFIVGNSEYFNSSRMLSLNNPLSEDVIRIINNNGDISENGRIYNLPENVDAEQFIDKEIAKKQIERYNDDQSVQKILQEAEKNSEGQIADDVFIYGMDKFPLSKLEVIDGDISELNNPEEKKIAAVYEADDNGKIMEHTNWAKVGDKVTIRYKKTEYADTVTGKIVNDPAQTKNKCSKKETSKEITYTVSACVLVKNNMSSRVYGSNQFVLNSEKLKNDSNTNNIMIYMFNVKNHDAYKMEEFLKDYVVNINPTIQYESKEYYMQSYMTMRNAFLIVGCVLSLAAGIIAILNMLNTILTSIISRKRDFALLKSIGMLEKQIKKMVVYEGMIYSISALIGEIVLSVILVPLIKSFFTNRVWFYTFRYPFIPMIFIILLIIFLGFIIPYVCYKATMKENIYNKLRTTE